MQTIAANLGSMTTPIGNPQNLYLYSRYNLSLGDFFSAMLPLTAGAAGLMVVFLLLSPSRKLTMLTRDTAPAPASSTFRYYAMYTALFLLCLCAVAKILSVWMAALIVLAAVFFYDQRNLFRVDYNLLLTFVGFFPFVGTLAALPAFRSLFQTILEGRELLCSVAVSQVISNVPAALLLSGFTENGKALLIGTNLGGLGTLIASMASLISFKALSRDYPGQKGRYLVWFTLSNLIFLAALLALQFFLGGLF
jgi:Na+/H+ antiporter NhaD/arsenite permease-like protein